ncbi:uncharacterized protein LOC143148077 [Ptiloglossa arizonensis]|uniref:uncharacterized protein LOC143148077 n=1 Tax=Ptiloglossa arizonensis TaxID=3350558 RepID=UPI003FA04243
MEKICEDPICPTNRRFATKKKPRKSKKKEPKETPSPKHVATTSKTSTTQKRKKSKSKSFKRTKINGLKQTCTNKTCQTSKLTVETSTSTNGQQTICVSSKDSVKSSKPRQVSRPVKRPICHCRDSHKPRSSAKTKKERRSRSRRKKSARRESDRKKKILPLCVCVRVARSTSRTSGDCECPSVCSILSKYNDCCCLNNKRKRSETRDSSSLTHQTTTEITSPNCCRCLSTPKSSRNVIVKGFSNLRRKVQNSKETTHCEYPKCYYPRERRTCSIQKCSKISKLSSKKQDRHGPERRKVKFRK